MHDVNNNDGKIQLAPYIIIFIYEQFNWLEHWSPKPAVEGSSPSSYAKNILLNMKQHRDRSWRRFKSMVKYISRLKEHMQFSLIKIDGSNTVSYIGKFRKPKSYKDFKENCHYACILKNTPCRYKDGWNKVDKKHKIHLIRKSEKSEILNGIIDYEHRYDEPDFNKMEYWWLDE